MSLHCNHGNSYQFVNGEEIYNFKDDKNVSFPTQFCLRSISNKFGAIHSKEVSLKENVYNYSAYWIISGSLEIFSNKMYVIK